MESFYGGRQGASFVIKGVFKFITDGKRYNSVTRTWEFVDEYYGQAWDELQLLETYWNLPASSRSSYANIDLLPKTQGGNIYTVADWQEELNSQTMSIYFNDYQNKDIWYGEYCIIDPANKNNRNNGKIYRRTLKGAGDEDITGGVAEYVGQIVGPAGPTPQLRDIEGVDTTESEFQSIALGLDDEVRFINQDGVWDESRNTGDTLQVKKLGRANNNGIKLIPGSTTQTQYPNHKNDYFNNSVIAANDGNKKYIQNGGYNWFDVRLNSSTDDISQIYIGFDFPYYVTDFVAGDVLPDVAVPEAIKQINTVTAPYDTAPFYERYKLNLPRGVRGGWFANIRTVVRVSGTKYYYPTAVSYQFPTYNALADSQKDYSKYPTSGHYSEDAFNRSETEVPVADWPIGAKGWIATFFWRSATPTAQPANGENALADGTSTSNNSILHKFDNVFLGLDREIQDITFSDTGTLTFKYNAWTKNASTDAPTDSTTSPKAGVRVNGESLTYTPQFETWIKKVDWIKRIQWDNIPSVTYSGGTSDLAADGSSINQGDNLTFHFNNDTMQIEEPSPTDPTQTVTVSTDFYTKNLRTIAGIKTFDDGSIRFYRSNGEKNDFSKRINWINGISTDTNNKAGTVVSPQNDTLIVHFNNNNLGLTNDQIVKNLRLITGINLTSDGVLEITRSDGTGHRSGGTSTTGNITSGIAAAKLSDLGPQLGWVTQVYRTSKDSPFAYYTGIGNQEPVDVYHLLIRFNNPTIGTSIGLRQVTMPNPLNTTQTWNDWFDLGVVQETINGIFFDQNNVTIIWNEGQVPPTGSPYGLEASDQLNWADYQLTEGANYTDYHRGLDGKALIATVIKRKADGTPYNPEKTQKAIFYYVSGDNGYTGWRVLNAYDDNNTIVIRSVVTQVPTKTIAIEDTFTPRSTVTLSTPWRVASS